MWAASCFYVMANLAFMVSFDAFHEQKSRGLAMVNGIEEHYLHTVRSGLFSVLG